MKRTVITKISVRVSDVLDVVILEGKDLSIIDTDVRKGNSKLIVLDTTKLDGNKRKYAPVAVFRKWLYWSAIVIKETNDERLTIENMRKDE